LDQRGQAAVTDALFMLLIISGLSVMLFVFSATYGQDISNHILRQYSVDYTTDALKTLLYSSTPRFPGEPLNPRLPGAAEEVDYLLAVVKEDYADSLTLNDETKFVLMKNVEKIMQPVSDQFDYLFLITTQAPIDYIYILLYKTEFICLKDGQAVSCEAEERDVVIVPPQPPNPSHKFYYCKPSSPQVISNLIFAVGDSSQSNSPMLLLRSSEQYGLGVVNAQASLLVWPATLIPSSFMRPTDLNCVEAPLTPPPPQAILP
jgi:hypothetical protein